MTDYPNSTRSSMIRVVIPESSDYRVMEVNDYLKRYVNIVNCEDYFTKINEYLEIIRRMEFAKNWQVNTLEKYLENPLHLASMMVHAGDADHLFAGAAYGQEEVIRSAVRIIGLQNTQRWIFSSSLLLSPDGDRKFTFADCSVIPEPAPEQLCDIAAGSAHLHEKLTGTPPVVAFISFSTKGSFSHYRVDRVIKAYSIFQKKYPDIQAFGEVQIDAAINSEDFDSLTNAVGLSKEANVLIFPNLDAANVAYQITKRLAGYRGTGSILHGLEKPVTLLPKTCSAEEITNAIIFASILKGEHAHLQLQM